jgi:hypothetical protein
VKNRKLFIVGLLLAYTIAVPVFAYMYYYKVEKPVSAGIVLTVYPTPNVAIGLYWDSECTQPVTSIDYGKMPHPNQETIIWKDIYIRNEGDVWVDIRWNSTLASVTSEITEWWWRGYVYWLPSWGTYSLNGTRIEPGQTIFTRYGIKIPAYATPGTYNWTIVVWGEHYY